MLKLDPHQEKMVNFSMNGKKVVNMFCDTGTGKTAFSLELANRHPELKFLILVHKKSMYQEWNNEMINFFGKLLPNVVLKAYTTQIKPIEHDVLIIDEVHRLKGTSQLFLNVVKYLHFRKVICLTATPIDSLNDLVFYWILQNQRFLKEIRTTANDLVASREVMKRYRKAFKNEFQPVSQKVKIVNEDGSVSVIPEIIGFKNKKRLQKIFKENSLFVKNYDVIDGIEKYTIQDFKKIRLKIDKEKISEAITDEEFRRFKINESHKKEMANYKKTNKELLKVMDSKRVLKDSLEYKNKNKNALYKLEILSRKQKELEKEIETLKQLIYPSMEVTPKWVTDKIEELFKLQEQKLKHIDKNSVVVYFFKTSEKYLEDNLKNYTRDPYEFIKGGYDFLITHASTIAEGVNGIQLITTKCVLYDFQQSRLRVEQLIGRFNRRGKVNDVEFTIFLDGDISSNMWHSTMKKKTMEEFIYN